MTIDREDIERAVEMAEEQGKGLFSRRNFGADVQEDGESDIVVLVLTGEYAYYGLASVLALDVLLEETVDLG